MTRLASARRHALARRGRNGQGIGAGTLVLTPEGELPVDHLAAGDRVLTRSGARVLRRVTSHVARDAFVVAPHSLGHDRPEAGIALGPAQALLLRDWRARALCAADQAAVPVARLADGEYIAPAEAPVRLWRLEFDGAEVIYAGGLEVAVPAPEPAGISRGLALS